jgi:hypothetical protein
LKVRAVLLAIATTLVVVAVVLAVSGGFRATVGGFRISARSPLPAAIAAVVAALAWLRMARRDRSIAADLTAAWSAVERHSTRIIGAVAVTAAIVASMFATRSAAGADASGYLSQARIVYQQRFFVLDELSLQLAGVAFDWPREKHWITTPLGWVPAEAPGMQAPTYPPGLPMLMAVPQEIAGINGAVAVIVLSTALAIWATGMLVGGASGVIAALLLGCSPVFLYQSFQPMSDVPVTAAWMLCFLLLTRSTRSFGAGVLCAIAVLIRPNLAPLALVPFLIANKKITFAAPVLAAGIFLGFLQNLLYGSPFRSGYGTAEELFALANIVPNTGRYFSWLIATAPVLFLAPIAFIRVKSSAHARALIAFALLVIGAYLVYAVFEHWSYLRFLLPAMAVFAIFTGIELARWIERWPVVIRFPMFLLLMLGLVAHGLFVARSFDAFKLKDQLRRVEQVAQAIDHTAPPNAVVIAGEQSGAMRYYTGRSILRWEAATPETFPKAIETLLKAERPIYIVLDAWEMELFRAKFPNVGPAELDWPPLLEAGSSHRTLAWNVADRWRFQLGQRINTIRLP